MDILFNNRYTKDCIRYCSLFPTTFEFTKDILVSLWIAQGWTTAGNDAFIEEACIQCFDILLKGRYIVPTGYDPHGDRIKYKVGEEMDAFLQDHLIRPQFSKELDGNYIEDFKLQHLSLSFKDIGQINFQIIKNLNRLQTLIIHGCYGFKATHLPFDLFRELKSLRILSISHTDVVELPSSIECSKELRYLDMSETPIRWLPESICNLSNLQTLELDNCLGLIRLPKRVKQLINLRHLILDIPRQLQSMPEGLGKLSKLRTLRAFFVGEEDGYTINELKQMNKLSGSLRILKLENIKTPEQAADASLCSKQDLKKIELQWSDLQDEINRDEEEILTRLEPPLGIQELKILYYSGGKLPSWIGNPSFSEMVSITLHKCRYCTSLPFLGQLPSLKFLNIIGMDEVKDVNKLFCGGKGINQHQPSFPALDKLTLDSMPELEIWTTEIRIGDFPCLMNLTIESCPKINCLPSLSNLKSLMHMEISYCPELSCLPDGRLPSTLESLMIRDSPKLNERCSNSQGEDWPKIAHVPIFYIDNMEVHTK
ncbi:putative disease resistance protein At3g14460 [Henckelia pumila]|uniref:putative disease resistance protein At3g14460 n=1 Tax=Henckelia pumila TaxID=405737 RepID=UPI003C6E3082